MPTAESATVADPVPIVDTEGAGPAVMRNMRIEIGERRRQRLVEANLPGEVGGDWAMEMHRRLVDPVEVHDRGFATMAVIEAPPVAWEVLERWIGRTASTAPIGVRKGDRHEMRSVASLGLKVRAELDRLALHPGYHGVMVKGIEPLVLPAFRWRRGDELDLPAPTPGRAIAVSRGSLVDAGEVVTGLMAPYAMSMRGETMTTWLWEPQD